MVAYQRTLILDLLDIGRKEKRTSVKVSRSMAAELERDEVH